MVICWCPVMVICWCPVISVSFMGLCPPFFFLHHLLGLLEGRYSYSCRFRKVGRSGSSHIQVSSFGVTHHSRAQLGSRVGLGDLGLILSPYVARFVDFVFLSPFINNLFIIRIINKLT